MSKLIIPFNFERQNKEPLEVDYKVETLTDLETLKSKKTTYEGMLTYCVESSTLYIFNKDGEFEPLNNGATTAENVTYQNDNYASLTNVKLALDQLIEDVYYVNPEITSFTATPNGGVFEIGETITSPITFDWTYNKNVSTQSLTDCILTDNTDRTSTYNSDITSDKTFTLSAGDGKENVTKSISYKFVYPIYTGYETGGLTKILKEPKSKIEFNATCTLDKPQIKYPKSWGNPTKFYDTNGFSMINSFTVSEETINGVPYYVYTNNSVTTITNFKYTMEF